MILGAGLDTFAYRNPNGPVHVFEVDHPATQFWKREALAAAGIAIPSSLTFAPVDFERQTLADGLADAGFDAGSPALFSWLGVTMYLNGHTFDSTLAFIAASPASSAVVFDYAWIPRCSRRSNGWRFHGSSSVSRMQGSRSARSCGPPILARRLADAGFVSVEDLGGAEIRTAESRWSGPRSGVV